MKIPKLLKVVILLVLIVLTTIILYQAYSFRYAMRQSFLSGGDFTLFSYVKLGLIFAINVFSIWGLYIVSKSKS